MPGIQGENRMRVGDDFGFNPNFFGKEQWGQMINLKKMIEVLACERSPFVRIDFSYSEQGVWS